MSESDTIREFLVGLGFDVDEAGLKRFGGSIGKATQMVTAFAAAGATTAFAIEAMVARVSSQMEDLYYVSQRSGASVSNLQALGYAAGQIGLTAETAQGAVEGLASALRLNPGTETVLSGLGVQTRDANGQLLDTSKLMGELVGKLKSMGAPGTTGFAMAARYAQMFGMDPRTLLMMEQGYEKLGKAEEDYHQKLKNAGIDSDALAEKSKDFANELKTLEADFGILAMRLEQDFLPIASKMVEWLDKLVIDFTKLDQSTDGWAGMIGTVAVSAMGVWIAKAILMRTILGGIAAEATAAGAAVAGATAVPAVAAAAAGAAGATGLAAGATAVLGRTLGVAAPLMAAILAFDGGALNEGEDERLASGRGDEPLPGGHPKKPRVGSRTKEEHEAIDYFIKQGWSKAAAAGITANLNDESSMDPGASGDNEAAFGLGQWHKDRQDKFASSDFRDWFKERNGSLPTPDIKTSTTKQQLEFVQYELTRGSDAGSRKAGEQLQGVETPDEAASIFSRFDERPKDRDGEVAKQRGADATELMKSYDTQNAQRQLDVLSGFARAGDHSETSKPLVNAPDVSSISSSMPPPLLKPSPVEQQKMMNVNVTSKTDINIMPGNDATETATRIADQQSRLNGDLVRNVAGVIQ